MKKILSLQLERERNEKIKTGPTDGFIHAISISIPWAATVLSKGHRPPQIKRRRIRIAISGLYHTTSHQMITTSCFTSTARTKMCPHTLFFEVPKTCKYRFLICDSKLHWPVRYAPLWPILSSTVMESYSLLTVERDQSISSVVSQGSLVI